MKNRKPKYNQERIKFVSKEMMKDFDKTCEEINTLFQGEEEKMRMYIAFYMITNWGSASNIIKYEWEPDGCPYDYSGMLKKDGYLEDSATIQDVFDNYTGKWEASYTSHYGKNWITFEDDLSYETLSMACSILRKFLKNKMMCIDKELTEGEIEEVLDEIYDSFYDATFAWDFFGGYPYFTKNDLDSNYNDFLDIIDSNLLQHILKNCSNARYLDYEKFCEMIRDVD